MNKYNAKRVFIDGMWFDSTKEGRRYATLKIMQRAGEITQLEVHPKYVLTVNGQKLGTYTPDFRYRRGEQTVVEDVKGGPTATPLFRWKAKHLAAEHGVTVETV